MVKHIAKLASDKKTTLASDQMHLPRIVPNGVPVYESLNNGSLMRMVKSVEASYLPIAVLISAKPLLMVAVLAAHWRIYYRVLRFPFRAQCRK